MKYLKTKRKFNILVRKQSELIRLKKRYDELKFKMIKLNNDHVLSFWKIIHEASKIGYELFGVKFSHEKLAIDFQVGRKTVSRCLALAYMNKKTERLIKEGKISASKVVLVLINRNRDFQDEIIEKIIAENISQNDLGYNLPKFNNKKEIEDWDFTTPIQKHSWRGDHMDYHLYRRINELNVFLNINPEDILDRKEVTARINVLQIKLNKFLKSLNGKKKKVKEVTRPIEYETDNTILEDIEDVFE